MSQPESFYVGPIQLFWASPALRASQDDHRPSRSFGCVRASGMLLNGTNLLNTMFEGCSHLLVHDLWIVALHNIRSPAIALK